MHRGVATQGRTMDRHRIMFFGGGGFGPGRVLIKSCRIQKWDWQAYAKMNVTTTTHTKTQHKNTTIEWLLLA
jgi:hypothetical protein